MNQSTSDWRHGQDRSSAEGSRETGGNGGKKEEVGWTNRFRDPQLQRDARRERSEVQAGRCGTAQAQAQELAQCSPMRGNQSSLEKGGERLLDPQRGDSTGRPAKLKARARQLAGFDWVRDEVVMVGSEGSNAMRFEDPERGRQDRNE